MRGKRIGFAGMAVVALLAGLDASSAENRDPLAELVEAEREFARTSVARGVREAFLTFMADDAIVFRPHAVNAKSWYGEQPEVPGVLNWAPVFADISLAGDMGYTTGPWEYGVKQSDTPTTYGHYVSVWKKQPDGSWRVVIDLGNVHAQPETAVATLTSAARRKPVRASEDGATASAGLLEWDKQFSQESARQGTASAYLAFSHKELRLYRMERLPIEGRKSAVSLLAESTGSLTWEPTAANVADSGDLGYTYGTSRLEQGEESSYVHIWTREKKQEWKLVLDVAVPLPPG